MYKESPSQFTPIQAWLEAKKTEHIRLEILNLIERGEVTVQETANLRCNSWEWEALVPAMNDEAFIAFVAHAIDNCAQAARPYTVYDEAVTGLYAPELLKRLKVALDSFYIAERELTQAKNLLRLAVGSTNGLVNSEWRKEVEGLLK